MHEAAELERRLVRYYDAEAAAGVRSTLGPLRTRLQAQFRARLHAEDRRFVVDVGAGPGRDVEGFADDGFEVVGLDLGRANVGLIAAAGFPAVVGSVVALPFASASCEAVWTMSTLVHVPDERLDAALGELVRIAAPGAPIAIGSWGGRDWEGISDVTRFDPPRFFSLRAHGRWRTTLARFGGIEQFETAEPDQAGWEYQFAVLRV